MACSEYSDRMIPLHRKSGVRHCCDASGDTVDSKISVLAAALRNFTGVGSVCGWLSYGHMREYSI